MQLEAAEIRPSTEAPLTRAQWMVLLAAFLGWLFDGYEQGLFPLIARPALQNILGSGGGNDGLIGEWMGCVTATFLVGAALGGVTFGWLGDRIGRIRAMSWSILVYSLLTGLGYFIQTPWELAAVRFASALGMGGQWALGVALVMECWPEKWRPWLAGIMGIGANVGFLLVGVTARMHHVTPESWRWIMLVGALPALLVFFVIFAVPESERWMAAARTNQINPVREIFSVDLRKTTLLALAFASIALIGTWGTVQWLPAWADQLAAQTNPSAKADTQMCTALGAIAGAWTAPLIGAKFGRRPAYFLLCAASFITCGAMFRFVHEFSATFLAMAFVVGAATASFYGWFPLYFPELFPTRVRATGQGFSYNGGRIFAAVGALTQGQLVAHFNGSYARAGAIVALIYLLGMVLIWLAPETKGKILPA